MKMKRILVMIIYIVSLAMILVGGNFRTRILFDWSGPLLPQVLIMLVSGEYFDRMDLPFEYLGSSKGVWQIGVPFSMIMLTGSSGHLWLTAGKSLGNDLKNME